MNGEAGTIDTLNEEVMTLTEAARILPRRKAGKKTHLCTLYRWSTDGCRGVKLETVQIGATRCTSREALQRFFERLTAKRDGRQPVYRTANQRRRASERAAQELEALGV